MFLGIDPLYWMLMLPVMLFSGWAQMKVSSAYGRFRQIGTRAGLTGARAAYELLERAGVRGVQIEGAQGFLSDHYDPSSRTLRLSPDVYHGNSIAAVGIAAHEAGHAIQHATGYAPLHARSFLVPVVQLGSWLAWPILILGFVLGSLGLVKVGILGFGAIVLFQLVTLPVEFNASSRAKAALAAAGVVDGAELEGVDEVLDAAAMTYVAATVAAIAQLLYFLLRSGLLGSRDD